MKKFLVVALVLAMACFSSAAFAVEVSISGSVDVRSRLFVNYDLDTSLNDDAASRSTTETGYSVTLDVKGDNVKGKLTLWNDHGPWGRAAANNQGQGYSPNGFDSTKNVGYTSDVNFREAWLDVMVPGTPVGLKAGTQLLQIGNGWFFRSNYSGTGAWVLYADAGPVNIQLRDAKIADSPGAAVTGFVGNNTNANDVDLYSAIVTAKVGDLGTVGLDFSMLRDDSGYIMTNPGWTAGLGTRGRLYNIGLQANLKTGPAVIKAEVDYQEGGVDQNATSKGYRGYQIVIQPSVQAGIVNVHALLAMGSGNKDSISNTTNGQANTQFTNILDATQHYTLLYEYRIRTATGFASTGFANTTALSVGAMAQVLKNLGIGADVYYLRATEQTNVDAGPNIVGGNSGGVKTGPKSYDLGWEIDGKVNWQITKDVSWNWQIGYFAPGGVYNTTTNGKADNCWGAQGVLGMSF